MNIIFELLFGFIPKCFYASFQCFYQCPIMFLIMFILLVSRFKTVKLKDCLPFNRLRNYGTPCMYFRDCCDWSVAWTRRVYVGPTTKCHISRIQTKTRSTRKGNWMEWSVVRSCWSLTFLLNFRRPPPPQTLRPLTTNGNPPPRSHSLGLYFVTIL